MSLKSFHIFFILLSILLAGGLGVWSIRAHVEANRTGWPMWGLLSLAGAAFLIFYLIRFFAKMKKLDHEK